MFTAKVYCAGQVIKIIIITVVRMRRKRFDGALSRTPVTKLEKFSRRKKKQKIKKLILAYRHILINIPMSSKMYCYFKCRLRSRRNTHTIKSIQK